MNKKLMYLAAIMVALAAFGAAVYLLTSGLFKAGRTQASPATDPQTLLVPRWFLRSLTVDGKMIDVPVDQQLVTIQFEPDGKVNGSGGCNSFGTGYQAGNDGKMQFEPIASTLMACEQGMDLENAYLTALAQVTRFKTDQTELTLQSADGKTILGFSLPPK